MKHHRAPQDDCRQGDVPDVLAGRSQLRQFDLLKSQISHFCSNVNYFEDYQPLVPLLKSQLFITAEHAAQCNGDNTSTLQKHKENQKYPDKVSVNFPVGEDSSVLTSNYQNYPLHSRHNCGDPARDVARLRELIPENWRVSRVARVSIKIFCCSPIQLYLE